MLRPSTSPVRARRRDNILTQFREFQDGELIAGTRYRVVRLIGVGGMGSVYEVEHIELGKRFVLKALLRELARREDLVARLRNEWRALARLQHANIVTVTDAGTSATGVPFYVMERLDGDTLAALLKRQRRLHVLEAVAISAQVLDALSAAHDIGIIHRDVKPANIFVVGGSGAVKLLDFGVAKIADATSVVTARGIAVGTPRYMSPEQARGERVDGRSDVYATGLILFEMIAGVGPYDDARDNNELLLAHLAREAPPLSSLVIGVAPELEQILAGMLAKDCRERPAHARIVAEQLGAFAARQRQLPATDAPTKAANYGALTVAGVPDHRSQGVVTRPDGAGQGALLDATRSDGAVTQPMLPPQTTQVTVTIHSGESLVTSSAPNTTYVSAPAFDGSTTLEMATLVPAYPPPSFGSSASYPAVERPERTEILGELTPAMPPDAVITRTHVPLVELARPNSLTPPPVVDAGRAKPIPVPRAPRTARTGLLAASGLALLAVVVGLGVRAGRAVPAPAATQTTTQSPAAPVAAAPAVPQPSLPAASAPSPASAPAAPSALSSVAAPLAASAAPEPLSPISSSAALPPPKPPSAAPSGPFLKSAVPVSNAVASSKPKPKPRRVLSGLPASGL
jgi:serine/threonine-protein kinase